MNEEAAAQVVEEFRHRRFCWGVADCKTFAAAFVDARTGSRFGLEIERTLGSYTNALEAIRIIREAGGWEAIITRFLGPPIPKEDARFGDIVLASGVPPFEQSKLLGICDEELAMFPGSMGLIWAPMSNARAVWKCPQP